MLAKRDDSILKKQFAKLRGISIEENSLENMQKSMNERIINMERKNQETMGKNVEIEIDKIKT